MPDTTPTPQRGLPELRAIAAAGGRVKQKADVNTLEIGVDPGGSSVLQIISSSGCPAAD